MSILTTKLHFFEVQAELKSSTPECANTQTICRPPKRGPAMEETMNTSLSMMEETVQPDAVHATSAVQAEGSHYRWVVLTVVWAAFLLSYVDRIAWSSVAAPVGHSLGLSVSMLGAFVTAFYVGYVLANIAGGIMTDVLGGRAMLTLALVPLGVFTFSFGSTQTLWAGIVIQFAMGMAAGADYSAGMKIIAAWTVLRDAPSGEPPLARIKAADVLALLKSRSLVLLAIAGGGGLWATVGFGAWGNALMTKQYGISPVAAGSIVACFGIGAVIAKPVLGWLSDVYNGARKTISILCLAAFAVMLFVFGQCFTVTQFYLLAPLLGAVAFGYTPVLMAQVSDASGRNSAGAGAGLTNAIWQSGSAVSPLVVGYFYQQTHSFSIALLTLAVGPVVGVAALLFLPG